MLSRGGFCLPKFTPNCISVLSKAPSERKSTPELNLDPNELPLESAFVVLWFVETDELGFKIRDLNRPETKRDILPSTCSAYDLLGFAASKTIKSSCAVDMYKMLMEKMDLPIKCTKQWTDNEIVLHYIKKCKMSLSDQHCQLCRRHKRELSEGSVESHAGFLTPADDVSSGLTPLELNLNHWWLQGLSFYVDLNPTGLMTFSEIFRLKSSG